MAVLSDGERERRYPPQAIAAVEPDFLATVGEAPQAVLQVIRELERGLDERIANEHDFGDGRASIGEVLCDASATPLRQFIDYIVYDECDSYGLGLSLIVQEPGTSDMQASATVVADYAGALEAPVAAMIVDADLSHYAGRQGARALAEEFYRAMAKVAAATAGV